MGWVIICLSLLLGSFARGDVLDVQEWVSGFYHDIKDPIAPFVETAVNYWSPKNNEFIRRQRDLLTDYWSPRHNMLTNTLMFSDVGVIILGRLIDKSLQTGANHLSAPGTETWVDRSLKTWPRTHQFLKNQHERVYAFLSNFHIMNDSAYTGRAQKIMNRLVPFTNDPILRPFYRVYVINIDRDQGFSTGGGSTYLTKGIMDALTDDELAGILAHEMSHTELKHVPLNLLGIAKDAGTMFGKRLEAGLMVLFDEGSPKEVNTIMQADLVDLYLQSLGNRSRAQEKDADQRGVEIIRACGCYDPRGLQRGIGKLIDRDNVLSTGSVRNYPSANERAGRSSPQVVLETDTQWLNSAIAYFGSQSLPDKYLGEGLSVITSTEVQKGTDTMMAAFVLPFSGSSKGKMILSDEYLGVDGRLKPIGQFDSDHQSTIWHELFHAQVQKWKINEDPRYNEIVRRSEQFDQFLSGQRETVMEELVARYIEGAISSYSTYSKKWKNANEDKRQKFIKAGFFKRGYEMPFKDTIVIEGYVGHMTIAHLFTPEEQDWINQLVFEGRVSGHFEKDIENKQ